ncbi:MAG TPA: hypothetical protein VFT09_09375, partial [Ilumatobacteraceae bacterium]|nr:hypothetical protein [Ilumatobacteraceae bacterium]
MVSPTDPTRCVAPPAGEPNTATVEPSADGSFTFFGPPGYYQVTVSHPDHETIPGEFAAQVPAIDHQCLGEFTGFPPTRPVVFADQPVYQLRNESASLLPAAYFRTLTDTWRLLRLRSVVTIEVRTDQLLDLPGDVLGDLLPGANVVFGLDDDANLTTPPATPLVNGPVAGGRVVVDAGGGVLPGLYQVRVSATDYYPLAFNVRVVPGGNPVTIQVPLPRTGGRIAGVVQAINSEQDPVLAPVGVVVSDAYDAPDPVVTNGTLGTVIDPASPADETAVTTPPGLLASYLFEGLGTGSHVLTFSDAGPAYPDTPGPIDVDVLGPATVDADPAVYGAANRTGTVTVTSTGNVLGAVVTLLDPDATTVTITLTADVCGVTPPPPPTPARATECTVELPPLPPETDPYEVSVSKTLYATDTESVVVPPGDPAVDIPIALTLAGSLARLNGQVRRVEQEGQTDALFAPSGTTVRLLQIAGDGTATPVATTTTASDGSYQIDATANGTYALDAALTGYAGRRGATFVIGSGAGALTPLGEEATVPAASEASIEKVATVTVDVSGTGLDVSTVTGVAIASGTGAPAATTPGARSGNRFTFSLDPAWSYQFRFTSTDGFLPAVVPAAAIGVDIGQDGDDPDYPVTMQPRAITGTVTGIVTGQPAGTVRVVTATGAQVGGAVDIAADGTYTLPGPFAVGDHRLVAEQLGGGRGTATANVATVDSPSVTQPITLSPRDVAVTFTSTPAGAAISVTASGSPALVVSGTAGTALTVPENRFPISYVASLAGYVSQTGSGVALAVIEPADTRWNAGTLTMTGPAVTLPGRTIGGSVSGATTANGAPGATVRAVGAAGTVVGAVAEGVTGSFTLPGPFGLDDYTIVAEQTGVGRDTASVEIDDGTDPSVTDVSLDLDPR